MSAELEDIHEECGIFGVWGHPDASRLTYFGLHALQHRGQEGAGIVSNDNGHLIGHRGLGLLTQVFGDEREIERLKGNCAIGHVRYATAGSGTTDNIQPFIFRFHDGDVALCHNGNLTNCPSLRRKLEDEGAIFHSNSDTEVLMHLIRRSMQRTFMENRKKIGDVNASLQDTLSGIRVVQSFTNEEIEKEKFQKSNHAFLVSKKDNYRCMGEFMSSNLFFQGMMYLVTLVYGGYLIANNEMSAADLAMYALYIGIFISPIQILVELTEMMQKGLSGFRRFLDVVETEPEIVNAPDAEPLENVKGEVEYKNVSFHYSDDDTPVLDRVSFKIPAGRSIALVGPSGSGKTTICSLLPRFYDVTGGVITIDGQDVRKLTLESLRSQIGLVQQDVYLFCGSIRENIAYGKPGASMEEIIDAAKKANIHEFIMSLPDGYDSFVGERGTRLSGGQKQRISIARVFLKNPPILILDEATSALDNESERWIQQSLEELAKNRTTITIAHRLSTIRNADEILVVANNGIAERGNHDELLEQGGIYAHYYEMS